MGASRGTADAMAASRRKPGLMHKPVRPAKAGAALGQTL
jgi:hypothetical protein